MAEWIYFIHPPRENFGATITDEEKAVWSVHFDRFQRLLAEGTIAGGYARGELRPFRISLLRGPDPGDPRAGLQTASEHPPA